MVRSCGVVRGSAVASHSKEPNLTAEILRIHPDEPEPALVGAVVASLNAGNVVALPTDTFYGLAVDPVNLRAVDRIYEIKSRARHKPLSLLISEVAQAYGLAREIDTAFDRLAERFWPGPLTIVVKAGARLPLRVTANTGNVALRVPEAAIARAVVAKLGVPITATSANLRGLPECTNAKCVRDQLGEHVPLIVDGGKTARAVPTTIVDLSGGGNSWMILREGAIPTHEIALTLQR
jgi:L-threonylcarbamoyladenylate synthase